ncbi:hypothetical protein NEIG_02625 [Nematocida sp. ERTm5]|nr:hypothetical protein NEIG_02625 [Nematocida sp. ERTm5]
MHATRESQSNAIICQYDTFSSLQKKQTIRRGKRGDPIRNEFLKYRDTDIRLDKEQKDKVNNFIKQQSSHASHFPSKPEITLNAQEMPETTVPEEAHTTEVPEAAVQVDEASEVSQVSVVSEEANQPISSSFSSIDTISADSLEEPMQKPKPKYFQALDESVHGMVEAKNQKNLELSSSSPPPLNCPPTLGIA